tara:strand:- start:51 stop:1049 length:999 start_codon:yes stop_codon:yes gene_type:complete
MYPSHQYLKMKQTLLDDIIAKKRKIKEVAEILNISRQSVSKWLAQYKVEGMAGLIPKKSGPKKGHAWNRTKEEIEDQVVEIAKNNPFKGPDWIADILHTNIGIMMHQSTVYRILKRKKERYFQDYKYKRRKKKAYCLDIPGREVQLDCSFPWGYQKHAVIFDAIDDCSRWVCGKVYKNHTAEMTISFLDELIRKAPFQILALRTDQGREFVNEKVKVFLQKKGIEHRINPPYTPQHNGKIERFHQTLKNDAVRINWLFLDDLESLNYKFTLFLYYYNHCRKHSGLGMDKLTPVQKIAYAILASSFDKNVNLMLQQNTFDTKPELKRDFFAQI